MEIIDILIRFLMFLSVLILINNIIKYNKGV